MATRKLNRMNKISDVAILCTGGTFDKRYDSEQESLLFKGTSATHVILKKAQAKGIRVETIFEKDSLDVNEDDLKALANAIEMSRESKIVVVHGTSRMIETAKYVEKLTAKAVIFIGAMVPHSIDSVESSFNLGFALGVVQQIDEGVKIAMSGEVFSVFEVVKNPSGPRFEFL